MTMRTQPEPNALMLARALRVFAYTRLRTHHAYTPKAMLKLAEHLTGKRFTRNGYEAAADALSRLNQT